MKFRASIESNGKTATGIRVPEQVVTSLSAGKRPPVLVTINGYTYRSSIAVLGGEFLVGVSAVNRAGARVVAGDVVDIDIEVDTEPRVIAVPLDLSEALASEPEATRFFDGLSYSAKQRVVLPIDDAKTAETRQRRIEKAVSNLREGKA